MRRREFLSAAGVGVASAALPLGVSTDTAEAAELAAGRLTWVRARRADRICDNYLINTKIFYANAVYKHTDAVMDLLEELGVRVIRERITTGSSAGTQNQLRAMPRLARRGIKWHGTVANLSDWPDAQRANRQVMDFLATRYAPRMDGDLSALMHSFGGCNEIEGPINNGQVDPNWARHARRMQRALWEQAKSNPRTRSIPIAGPSTRTDFTRKKAEELGDLSRWSDLGNAHLYNKGTSPSRGIDDHLKILRPVFPGIKRYIFTETGYNNSPQDNRNRTVPEFASAIYAVRGIFDYFQRRSIYGRFELLDDPDRIDYSNQFTINRTADIQAHFGLVAMTEGSVKEATPDTWRKKPEFHAIKNLLRLLSDEGPRFDPKPLRMGLSGVGGDVRRLLLQKRDGRHYLVLWRDVQVSELYPEATPIRVDPVRVSVRLGTARPIRVWSPSRSARPMRRESARTTFNVRLGKHLTIVEIG
ncbi:hypothetical protein BH20ACT6_BH20ACT6_07330 [soil metagenome]